MRKGKMKMSKKNYTIEDLMENHTALTPLTEEHLSAVEGGVAPLVGAVIAATGVGIGVFVGGAAIIEAVESYGEFGEFLGDKLCEWTSCNEPEPEPTENSWEHPLSGVYGS
jgi:hypothetical protein